MRLQRLPFVVLFLTCLFSRAARIGAQTPEAPKPVEIKSIKVVDGEGKPIAGAKIVRRIFNIDPVTGARSLPTLETKGTTDATGSFALPALKADDPSITLAWAPGFSIGHLQTPFRDATKVAADGSFAVELLPAKPFHFRLVDMAGKPVAGCTVKAMTRSSSAKNNPGFAALFGLDELIENPTRVSDAEGAVAIDYMAEQQTVSVALDKSGFQRISATLQVPADEGLAITLVPGANASGRLIKSTDGTPLGGQKIVSFLPRYTEEQTEVAADGRFVLEGLDEFSNAVQLASKDWVTLPHEFTTKRGENVELGDIKVGPACEVVGTVSGFKKPEAISTLRSYFGSVTASATGGKFLPWSRTATFDGEGHYKLWLPPGKFTIRTNYYSNEGSLSAAKDVEVTAGPAQTVDLALAKEEPRRFEPAVNSPPAQAAAAKPVLATSFRGKVLDKENGEPLAGVMVWAFLNRQKVRGTVTGDDGTFLIDRLPVQGETPVNYIVTAEADGMFSPLVSVTPYQKDPITIRMILGDDFTVRVVDTAGKTVAGAEVEITKYYFADPVNNSLTEVRVNAPGDMAKGAVKTDTGGVARLPGVPSDSFIELSIKHPDYAPFTHVVAAPFNGPATLTVSREAVFKGHVALSDGRLLPVLPAGPWHVQAQTWEPPWYHRYGDIDAQGNYELHGVPSLELMNATWLSFLVDSKPESKTTVNGITTAYTPTGRGYNVLLTMEKDGRKEWWITYAEAEGAAITYKEGETVTHNVTFYPMAYLKGRLIGAEGEKLEGLLVSYRDPRSIYGDWPVKCDKDGKFEIPVPPGDVTLQLRRQEWGGPERDLTVIKDLKPQEVREVEIKTDAPAPAVNRMMRNVRIRVLGPDGATIPRPELSFRNGRWNSQTRGDMDGLAYIYGEDGTQTSVEISSPYLNQPVKVPYADGPVFATLRFDKQPPGVPALNQYFGAPVPEQSDKNLEAPKKAELGEPAPELVVKDWVSEKPLKLADLKGKIVLLVFGGMNNARWENLFLDKPFAIIKFQQPYEQNELPGKLPKTVIGVAKDPLTKNGQGYNAQLFGANYSSVLIGPDGRIAARGLSGIYLRAKIEQLLAQSAGK